MNFTYLGNSPGTLDTERYIWGPVKLPKGKSWKNNTMTFRDNEFLFSEISFYDADPDLFIKFRCARGLKQCPLYLTVKNYAELTVFDIERDLCHGSDNPYPLGRHFHDGILMFFHLRRLSLCK